MPVWDAQQYLHFADERTRPCRDLAARIPVVAPTRVIDLGCGPGNSTAVLAERWPEADLTGLDNSPEMIATARREHPTRQWITADIAAWAKQPVAADTRYDVVFSNAALQWVGVHTTLVPALWSHVAPGGALAIQMPANFEAPAHRLMRELAASSAWRSRFPAEAVREWQVHALPFYYDLLAPHAAHVDGWETEYMHILPNPHAIVAWYQGSGLRPFLQALPTDADRTQFLHDFEVAIQPFFPPRADGRILFPFRRLFVIAHAPS